MRVPILFTNLIRMINNISGYKGQGHKICFGCLLRKMLQDTLCNFYQYHLTLSINHLFQVENWSVWMPHLQGGHRWWNWLHNKLDLRVWTIALQYMEARQSDFKIQTIIKVWTKPNHSHLWASSGCNYLLKSLMFNGAEESRLEHEREDSFQKSIRFHNVGFSRPFKTPSTWNNYRIDITKMPIPTNPHNLLYAFLSSLASWNLRLYQRRQGRVGKHLERNT